MAKTPTMKTWLWIAIIIVVSIIIYFAFLSDSSAPDNKMLETVSAEEDIGAQVLVLLNEIRSLKIDSKLFQSAAYQALEDYSITIPEERVGRDNPFAPIPGYIPPATTPAR